MGRNVDTAVAAYVATRHRVIGMEEAQALDLSARQVERRVASERWTALHRGVYLVGGGEPSPWGRCRAALLATGGDAWVTHESGLALWHVCPLGDGPVHVTCLRRLVDRDGIEVHWTRHAPATVHRHGIRTTTLGRALADAAELCTGAEMEPYLRSAQRLHGFDRRAVPDIPGRRGRRRARGGTFARGELVKRVLRLIAGAGLPAPYTEYELLGHELDLAWPEQRIALEVDDYETHDNREAMDADRARDRALTLAGWRVVRVTATQIDSRLLDELRLLLEQ